MGLSSRHRLTGVVALVIALLSGGCGSAAPSADTVSSPGPVTAPSAAAPSSASPVPSVAGSAAPSASATGFAFAAPDIAAYYESQGYRCSSPQPSAQAAGYTIRTCGQTDAAGRTRTVGLVTDADGALGNAFASVKGTDEEPILAPIDVLEPLSGFLGATLGEAQGTSLLTWLASHLGDAYASTTIGPIRVATFTESPDDHSTLYVEVADQAYLDAPPAPSP